ncbi:hypothetical protein NHX12_023165 [Muraenolepis orangiensis]|uniref:Protein TOPAZ1 n=1 Tax=Muraenolepis orangiensis TaxID=630683 RepID=A0A9Q0ELM6_9TELE|nr:hypothetical protein NHX12_023165 [Muraenolepis orangiensis]
MCQVTSTGDCPLVGGEEVLSPSVSVDQWSKMYTDVSLPWPLVSPLSSPTRPPPTGPSSTGIPPNQRSQGDAQASLDSMPDEMTAYEHDVLLVHVVQDDAGLLFEDPGLLFEDPGLLLEDPGLLLEDPGLLLQDPGLLLEDPGLLLEDLRSTLKPSPLENARPHTIEEESDGSPSWPATQSPSPSTSWPTEPAVGQYCRYYFSETLSCVFNVCWFLHSPVEGDEKFCVESVLRFLKNPRCLQKACAVFTDYYQKNPPGVWFSNHVMSHLLWALLEAGLYRDIHSVLGIALAHNIPVDHQPLHEFLLELFNVVREKSLTAILPDLMRLLSQAPVPGLPPCAPMSPAFQGNAPSAMLGSHMLLPPATNDNIVALDGFQECLNLAHAIVEVKLCTKHQNWLRLGLVLRWACRASLLPADREQLSGRVAVALLTESHTLPVPFVPFTDPFRQECDDGLTKNTLGRIGVSLMYRYHKTQQWVKGRRVAEVLSGFRVAFSTLKGLFGDASAVSRCGLVTVAAELFLQTGSIEGALDTLRDDAWFLASGSWPCEPGDLEKRSHLLMRLAENTSRQAALEILSNLPGLQDVPQEVLLEVPQESVDVSRYAAVFHAHLQACVDRQMLPVASDLAELILLKGLTVEAGLLQTLLNRLGNTNSWFAARKLFRRALNGGYYPGVCVPRVLWSLCVPSTLGEMEMALCLEMFITVNHDSLLHLADDAGGLCITLKRSQTDETLYLAACSRLYSAAGALQPKLAVHFWAANPLQERVFALDTLSARLWLEHNHVWANQMWSRLSWQ